ncbi:MAG: MotA/TolQ/ExbB proton channel family protein [Pyrinomonadaceae bacterium]|nr:MotA/TolQ/ExbB proton channel family protein [Phycisphaerales bacterium]
MKDPRFSRFRKSAAIMIGVLAAVCTVAVAQTTPPDPVKSSLDSGLLDLFLKSIDMFTVLLVLGSIVSVAVIIQCMWEIRARRILPLRPTETITRLANLGQWTELRHFTSEDNSFLSRVVRAAMNTPGEDRIAIRDAAELTASEECARWFRKIEPLNIVGNLGPLLGLAGTVWGMIIAFTSLGQGGGQANPGELALGISKALFHTLLGLLLAVPSLLVFGLYRTKIDRHCTRAMVTAAEIVEMIPVSKSARGSNTSS